MARRHVRDLVRHHASEFCFIVSGQNQPRIHVEKPTGQSKGVDVVRINHPDRKWNRRIRVPHQVLPDAIDILGDNRILHHLGRLFHLLGVFLSHPDLTFDAVPLPQSPAATHVAISNRIQIAQAAVVIHLYAMQRGSVTRGRIAARPGPCAEKTEKKEENYRDGTPDTLIHGSPQVGNPISLSYLDAGCQHYGYMESSAPGDS